MSEARRQGGVLVAQVLAGVIAWVFGEIAIPAVFLSQERYPLMEGRTCLLGEVRPLLLESWLRQARTVWQRQGSLY